MMARGLKVFVSLCTVCALLSQVRGQGRYRTASEEAREVKRPGNQEMFIPIESLLPSPFPKGDSISIYL
jgi:hypothetical protein